MWKLPSPPGLSKSAAQDGEMFVYTLIWNFGFLIGSVGISLLPIYPSFVALGCGALGFIVAMIFGVACRYRTSIWPFSIWFEKRNKVNASKNQRAVPTSRELDFYGNVIVFGGLIWLVGLGLAFEYRIIWGPLLTFIGACLLGGGALCFRFNISLRLLSWIFQNDRKKF